MRRFLVTLTGAFLLFVGCAGEQQPTIPPEEVLSNAAQASLALQSARYELRGSFVLTDSNNVATSGTLTLDGVLQDAGKQIEFDASLAAKTAHPDGDMSFAADASVIVGGPADLFVKLERYTAEGPSPFFNPELVEQFSGKWWRIPPARGEQLTSMSVTPDPRLLSAQAQVVKVVRDLGLSSLHNRPVYRYEVAVDHEKLIAYLKATAAENAQSFDEQSVRASVVNLDATGELWIDKETFYVQRLQWKIAQGVSESAKSFSVEFVVDFFDHDSAASITIPTDAAEFTPLMFYDAPSGLEMQESLLPPGMEEDMIQQLLEQGSNEPLAE